MRAVMDMDEIKRIIKATKSFVFKGDERPALKYVRLDFNKDTNKVKATALDGIMMSIEYGQIFQIDESFAAYIKPQLPIKAKGDYVEIAVNEGFCYITVGDNSFGYRQPEIKWLDTDKIINDLEAKEISANILVNNERLAAALKSIDSGKIPVKIEYRGLNTGLILRYENSVRMFQVCRQTE